MLGSRAEDLPLQMLLLGHRGAGASRHIPENTLESFELCLRHGCDGFEFDVRLAADGVAVVCHDPVIGGREVAASPSDELSLPTLDEVLRQFSPRAFLDIELKVGGLEKELLAALRTDPPKRGYVVSSFLPEVLNTVYRLDSRIPLGFIYKERGQAAPFSPPVDYLIPHLDLLSRELVEEAHASARKIMTWTVNRSEDMLRFAGWGVDAMISDETELLVHSFR